MELKWSNQRAIANSKIVKSSVIWLVAVPFAAKGLASLDKVIELTIFSGSFKLSTVLPFSWQLLFFSACFFTLASLIYSMFCPAIVKTYENHTQFEADGKTRLQINSALKKIVWNTSKNEIYNAYKTVAEKYFSDYRDLGCRPLDEYADKGLKLFEDIHYNKGKNSNAFYYVYSISDTHGKLFIAISLFSYIGGFLSVGIIAIQNIFYVVNTLS